MSSLLYTPFPHTATLTRSFLNPLNSHPASPMLIVFSKTGERLLVADIAGDFLQAIVGQLRSRGWLSDERFSGDGTLLEASGSEKSIQRKPTPPELGSGARAKGLLHDLCVSKTEPVRPTSQTLN